MAGPGGAIGSGLGGAAEGPARTDQRLCAALARGCASSRSMITGTRDASAASTSRRLAVRL